MHYKTNFKEVYHFVTMFNNKRHFFETNLDKSQLQRD